MNTNARYWLKSFRNNLNMTQLEVAKNSGISRSYYTKLELGIKTPQVEVAKRIANVLGFEWPIFFDDICSFKEQKQEVS